MAIKAVNDIIGPDNLILTLLVYKAYLYISNLNSFTPFIINQVIVI